jgi:hypothetical protein
MVLLIGRAGDHLWEETENKDQQEPRLVLQSFP